VASRGCCLRIKSHRGASKRRFPIEMERQEMQERTPGNSALEVSAFGLGCMGLSFGAEALSKHVPHAEVVAAFNSTPSEVRFGVFEGRGNVTRPSLVYCGDTQTGKCLAARRIRDVGFDPVDAGPLRIARYIERFALLAGQLTYGGKGGARTGAPVRAVSEIGRPKRIT
jgi:hypothetical protein